MGYLERVRTPSGFSVRICIPLDAANDLDEIAIRTAPKAALSIPVLPNRVGNHKLFRMFRCGIISTSFTRQRSRSCTETTWHGCSLSGKTIDDNHKVPNYLDAMKYGLERLESLPLRLIVGLGQRPCGASRQGRPPDRGVAT